MQTKNKRKIPLISITLLAISLVLSPFFMHVWDMNILTQTLKLIDNGINPFSYYYEKTRAIQESTNLPVFVEGYTYPVLLAHIFYPFYKLYVHFYGIASPITTSIQVLHLLDVKFVDSVFMYNLIIKLPLILLLFVTSYFMEKYGKKKYLLIISLLYAMLITSVLGMSEIIVGLSLLFFVYFFEQKRYIESGIFYAFSLVKPYTIILLPYIAYKLMKTNRKLLNLAMFLIPVFIIHIPTLLYFLKDPTAFIYSTYMLQKERIMGGITFANSIWTVEDFWFDYSVSKIYSLFFIASYLVVLVFTMRSKLRFYEAILLLMVVFLFSSKVVNEQYFLAVLPLFYLIDDKYLNRLLTLLIIFIFIRINPVYFSAPLLYEKLPSYETFITQYYSFVSAPIINRMIKLSLYVIGLLFSLHLFLYMLPYRKKDIRRREVEV
ncbi:MAG: hypothetical protein J7K83_00760 [Candidatus Aenigmarchaeota archaeon]|nr:hypothetical protein [Candidatus Aenigmarchaeota archaeon]